MVCPSELIFAKTPELAHRRRGGVNIGTNPASASQDGSEAHVVVREGALLPWAPAADPRPVKRATSAQRSYATNMFIDVYI